MGNGEGFFNKPGKAFNGFINNPIGKISNDLDKLSGRMDTPGMRQYCFNEGMGDPLSNYQANLRPDNGANIHSLPCTLNPNLTKSYADGYNYSHK